MTSESVSKKIAGPTIKQSVESSNKNTCNDKPTNQKNDNSGLRIPGSNWQKFKAIVTEKAPCDKASNAPDIKRKRFNRREYNIRQKKNTSSCTDLGQIAKEALEEEEANSNTTASMQKPGPYTGLTKVIAMDCEMVGIGDGQDSMIARVSIVNHNGICVYDKYVKPTEEVQDYRTAVSGIRPHHLAKGENFKTVQKEVADILSKRILVGHALHNDLGVLFLSHPSRLQRDTSRYKLFRKVTNGNTPSLKKLASELLGVDIQSGEHSSVEDARVTMQLYQLFKKKWESDLRRK